ncbi:uncharacterized protein J3D65DRAFT_636916 [Phyllosticta citribraziliensis]|uniref:Uncharacterized protein n=1 Tax=Phyllosticta citribraziliensis TaxID=989973 RepID=A0ABR1LB50_9PEZI
MPSHGFQGFMDPDFAFQQTTLDRYWVARLGNSAPGATGSEDEVGGGNPEDDNIDEHDNLDEPAPLSTQQPIQPSEFQLTEGEAHIPEPVKTYRNELARGIRYLLRAIWKYELKQRETLKNTGLTEWLELTIPVIAATHHSILREVVCGNLSKAYRESQQGSVLQEQVKYQHRKNHLHPSIYMIMLVDHRGHSPTPNELLQVLDAMETYARPSEKSNELAKKIDRINPSSTDAPSNVFRPSTSRRFINKANTHTVSDKRREMLLDFCGSVRKRLASINQAERDKPFAWPLRYFGYAKNGHERMKSHQKWKSSNYLMSLTTAMCHDLSPGRYHLDAFTICFLSGCAESMAAEIIFACVGNSYAKTGGGFNIAPAGESNQSANEMSQKDWNNHCRFILNKTAFHQNIAAEVAVMVDEDKKEANLLKQIAEDKVMHKQEFEISLKCVKAQQMAQSATWALESKIKTLTIRDTPKELLQSDESALPLGYEKYPFQKLKDIETGSWTRQGVLEHAHQNDQVAARDDQHTAHTLLCRQFEPEAVEEDDVDWDACFKKLRAECEMEVKMEEMEAEEEELATRIRERREQYSSQETEA